MDSFPDFHTAVERRFIEAIGSDDPTAGPSPEDVEECRKAMARHLDCEDIQPVRNEACQTDIRAGLLGAPLIWLWETAWGSNSATAWAVLVQSNRARAQFSQFGESYPPKGTT